MLYDENILYNENMLLYNEVSLYRGSLPYVLVVLLCNTEEKIISTEFEVFEVPLYNETSLQRTLILIGTFRWDHEYGIEYENDFQFQTSRMFPEASLFMLVQHLQIRTHDFGGQADLDLIYLVLGGKSASKCS